MTFIVCLQVVNNAFNAAQFRANANHSTDVSNARLALSFVGSVAAAGGVAYSLRTWEMSALLATSATRTRYARALSLLVPFLSAAAGKPLQIGLMRSHELTDGVHVHDAVTGAVVRNAETDASCQSRVAGAAAVLSTTATRVLYLIQPILVPAIVFASVRPSTWAHRHPALLFIAEVLFVASMSAIATPLCVALFDQHMRIPTKWLEPSVRKWAPHDHVVFHRGI